jgi:hypothetical protein
LKYQNQQECLSQRILKNKEISDIDYKLIPITITCSYEEDKIRMVKDGRDEERINQALAVRSIYDSFNND